MDELDLPPACVVCHGRGWYWRAVQRPVRVPQKLDDTPVYEEFAREKIQCSACRGTGNQR